MCMCVCVTEQNTQGQFTHKPVKKDNYCKTKSLKNNGKRKRCNKIGM